MSETKQESAGSLKPGKYVVFDGVAYSVKSIDISKTGKHGSTKCRIEAVALIDGRKIVKILPSSDNIEVPIIEKRSAQILSISNDISTVMDTDKFAPFDLKISEDLRESVKEGSEVLYWTILGDKVMKQVK